MKSWAEGIRIKRKARLFEKKMKDFRKNGRKGQITERSGVLVSES